MKPAELWRRWTGACNEQLLGKHRQEADGSRGYRQLPSFSDWLPWLDILADGEVLLEDGCSCAAVLELEAVAVEGKSDEFMRELQQSLARVLSEGVIERLQSPWVLQLFAFIDPGGLGQDWQDCAGRGSVAGDWRWQRQMQTLMDEHMQALASERGLFDDPLLGRRWRGCRRRVIACFYRRAGAAQGIEKLAERRAELATASRRLTAQLESVGVRCRPCAAEAIRHWLSYWFAPSGSEMQERDPAVLSAQRRRVDYTLADAVCGTDIRSDASLGCWYFGGRPQRVLSLQTLRATPTAGRLSAEQTVGEVLSCPLEQLPPGTIIAMTLVFVAQESIQQHLDALAHSAIGETAAAVATREGVTAGRQRLLGGDKVYPFALAVFVRGADDADLERRCVEVDTLFLSQGLQLVPPHLDPVALDAWLRHLPMGYRYSLDQLRRRNRLIYSTDAAALLPLYGRARGSGRPGLSFFNRGGELFSCDPLSPLDRSRNAHLFIFGPTGSGKSATLVYLQMMLMAFQRPRIVAVEAGNSYGLLADYFRSQGLVVEDIVLRPGCGSSLPPFAPALRLAQQSNNAAGEQRDLLAEMLVIAKLMVTGGQPGELARFSRADEATMQGAILDAAGNCVRQDRKTVRVSDVREALYRRAEALEKGDPRRIRRQEMADAISLFTVGFAGELFDREGDMLPDADYLRFEMGTLAGEQYRDQLSVAWLGLINAVIARAEHFQRDSRPTILLTDEAHVITTNALLASYLVQISKLLGRRLGLWIWMATQNMKDFQGESEKMLAMFEWWLCLHVGRSELPELLRFRALSPDQQAMLLSARKLPGCYTEGLLLSDTVEGRFRNVPPALCLALAQTEKEEKAERGRLMAEYGCSELEAALRVAEQIAAHRGGDAANGGR